MADPIAKETPKQIDMEGLEVLFENSQEVLLELVEDLQEEALPIAKAASMLGIHRRYALDLLHQGKLEGFKNSKGQWLVKQNSIQSRMEDSTSTPPPLQEVWLEPSRRGLEDALEVAKEDPRDKIIKDLQNKLEAATFRVGYLQHQVESQEEQLKLLTDSQHKPSWQHRLRNLFSTAF